MQFIRRIRLSGLLSFPPDMEPLELQPLNVLIGPNGSGKTNFIEAFELLRSTPTDFAAAIRNGGDAQEWLWKGENPAVEAELELETGNVAPSTGRPLRYRLAFKSLKSRVEVVDEAIEEVKPDRGHDEPYFYYRFQRGQPIINVKGTSENSSGELMERHLKRDDLLRDQSVLPQLRDPERYPEITWTGKEFGKIRAFRDWTFGPRSVLRNPQRTSNPPDELLPNAENYALVLNEIKYLRSPDIAKKLKRFLPRFEEFGTRIFGNAMEFYIREQGLTAPISAMRISDGALRFLAILATLYAPTTPPLVCIEEPELGLHPDALSLLAELLVEASNRMQLVVTTHSDALLSALNDQVESVLVCENDGYGTKIKRLNAKRLAHWLDEYTLGDIWRIGEIGGNP